MPSRVHSILGVSVRRADHLRQSVESLVTSLVSLTHSHFANLNLQATSGSRTKAMVSLFISQSVTDKTLEEYPVGLQAC